MSFESLIGQDTVTFKTPTIVKDAGGGATRPTGVIAYANVPARVRSLSGREQDNYMQKGIVCEYEIITSQDGVLNDYLAITSDGRTLRVTGRQIVTGMGGIFTYFKYPATEKVSGVRP